MFKLITFAALSILFAGCQTFVPVRDLDEVSDEVILGSTRVRIYTIDNPSMPNEFDFVEEVIAYSCKHLMTDPPASKGDALKRLKIEAYERGADAVVNVTFDTRGTDAWGTNCWESVQASGLAVKLK